MTWPQPSMWRSWLALLAWTLLLALLPWWLGLPLLLAPAFALLLLQHRLTADHARLIRRALRWGLPGVLWSLRRALGGDAFATGAALLGVLVGYTLLAGLEAWLDRDRRRDPLQENQQGNQAEWPDLAMAPIGPPAGIIELQLPDWRRPDDMPPDVQADHARIDDAAACVAIDAQGDWLALRLRDERGIVLLERSRRRQHRLRGWQLAGWHQQQPWLMRREGDMPVAFAALLKREDR